MICLLQLVKYADVLREKRTIPSAIGALEDESMKAILDKYFHRAGYFERDNPMMLAMLSRIGFSEEQLDNLFRLASNP